MHRRCRSCCRSYCLARVGVAAYGHRALPRRLRGLPGLWSRRSLFPFQAPIERVKDDVCATAVHVCMRGYCWLCPPLRISTAALKQREKLFTGRCGGGGGGMCSAASLPAFKDTQIRSYPVSALQSPKHKHNFWLPKEGHPPLTKAADVTFPSFLPFPPPL